MEPTFEITKPPGANGRMPMASIDFDDISTPIEGTFLPHKEFLLYASRSTRWQWWLLGWMAINSLAIMLLLFATVARWN